MLLSPPAFAGAVTAHLNCWISTFCPLRLRESHPSLQNPGPVLQHSVKTSDVCTHHLLTSHSRLPALSTAFPRELQHPPPAPFLPDCSFTFFPSHTLAHPAGFPIQERAESPLPAEHLLPKQPLVIPHQGDQLWAFFSFNLGGTSLVVLQCLNAPLLF